MRLDEVKDAITFAQQEYTIHILKANFHCDSTFL